MLQPQSDLSWLDTKSLLQLHAASLEQMRDSIRLMTQIEEELALQPHQSRVGLTLSNVDLSNAAIQPGIIARLRIQTHSPFLV